MRALAVRFRGAFVVCTVAAVVVLLALVVAGLELEVCTCKRFIVFVRILKLKTENGFNKRREYILKAFYDSILCFPFFLEHASSLKITKIRRLSENTFHAYLNYNH